MKIADCKFTKSETTSSSSIRSITSSTSSTSIVLQFAIYFIAAGSIFGHQADGAEPAVAANGFQGLLELETRRSLKAVSEYLAKHPDADDADAAAEWLFTTASQQGLESEVLPTAEAWARKSGVDASLQGAARQVLALGLARSGKVDAAVEQFSMQLLGARRQQPGRILPFAHALATRSRIQGDLAAARQVYEKLQDSFPLNGQVSQVVAARLARMELIGKPAPKIDADDVDGKRVSLTDPEHTGKVVLVDFWATNCLPCLEELPSLQRLYKELHPQGFEIVGVSLDERADLVTEFRERRKIPWRQVLSPPPQEPAGDGGAASSELMKRYGVTLIPALIVIDREGQVAQVDVHGNDLREVVLKLLGQKAAKK